MKATDLQIEELQVAPGFVQGYGHVRDKPFEFRAKRGFWEFTVCEDESLPPWVVDPPSEHQPGMYIIQRQKSPEMSYSEAERIILRCADAYLFMIGRRQSDLSEGS